MMNQETTQALLARWLADDPSAAEALRALCVEDPAVLDQVMDAVLIDRLLRHQAVDAGAPTFAREVHARLIAEPDVALEFKDKIVYQLHRRRGIRRWAAMAAGLVLCALVAGTIFSVWRRQPSAWITGAESAQWQTEMGHVIGEKFQRGQRLLLSAGFVSVKFAQGAEVILEGAAEFEIAGPNRAVLHRGSAVAKVPDSAHGFTIDGPGGKIVDLGTEFAVRTVDKGMEVHVLDGEVEMHPTGQAMVSLRKDSALRVASGKVENFPANPSDFLTALPPRSSVRIPWLQWSFDEGQGTLAKSSGWGLAGNEADGVFSSLRQGGTLPTWTSGYVGRALYFNGQEGYVQTGFPGFSGSSPRTVACWVKAPRDQSTNEGYSLVSWGPHNKPGDTWQLSLNPDRQEGPLGRLRVGTFRGFVIGTTDLRDGQWHHVAAVLYEGFPANVATHILLYVDGQLEPSPIKSVMEIDTDTTSPQSQRVAFGKNTAIRAIPNNGSQQNTFRGAIDEVMLCSAALSQKQIRRLMLERVVE